MAPPLHDDCAPVAFLVGTWTGEGRGSYPTIEPFSYGEEVRFAHNGKPFLAYTQRTWALHDERPLHAETGYLRPKPGSALELVLAQPTGHAELGSGRIEGRTIEVVSELRAAPTAKDVTRLVRRIAVDGDVLRYTVDMQAVGVPLTRHLSAELRRTS